MKDYIEAHVIGQERKRAMFIEEAIEPVIGHTEFAQKRSRELLSVDTIAVSVFV